MSASIVRWKYPSPKHCLLTASAVAMSAYLPSWLEGGQWIGQLRPEQVISDYERYTGREVPTIGADPETVYRMCREKYNMGVWPKWNLSWEETKRISDWGIPIMVPYVVWWDFYGQPAWYHAVTNFEMHDNYLTNWDQDAGIERMYTASEWYGAPIYREGVLYTLQRFSGWSIIFGMPEWGDPDTW